MSKSTLRSLSNDDLVSRLRALVARERRDTIAILHHLGEVERRGLHRRLGYPSLFAYCTECLGYSDSAAGRRVQAARCMRRYPFVEGLLERREVTLSSVTAVAGIALSRNEPELFERIRGKTKNEVAAIVAGYRPRKLPRDRVKVLSVKREAAPDEAPAPALLAGRTAEAPAARCEPAEAKPGGSGADAGSARAKAGMHSRSGSAAAAGIPGDGGGSCEETAPRSERVDAVETKYQVQFVAGADLMRAIEQIRALLSFRLPADASMESLLAVVCEEFIERHSPKRRMRRRENRARSRTQRPGHGTGEATPRKSPRPTNPRSIPAAVRDVVFSESGGQCTYVGADGHRCAATRHLQIDHIQPVVLGGGSEPANLRVLCATHNRLEAERLLGKRLMERYPARE